MKPEKEFRLKVLAVDDHKHVVTYIRRICSQFDLDVFTETDPQLALDRIWKNEFFDILIIDHSYTDFPINGLYILTEVMRNYMQNKYVPYIPILVIASGLKEIFKREQKSGIIFDFLERPFGDAELKRILEKAIKFLKGNRENTNDSL